MLTELVQYNSGCVLRVIFDMETVCDYRGQRWDALQAEYYEIDDLQKRNCEKRREVDHIQTEFGGY